MNEELAALLEAMGVVPSTAPDVESGVDITGGELQRLPTPEGPSEQELTEEIRGSRVVLNTARGKKKPTNALSFLANPEVQNALITFGQAFSNAGNFTGRPNPIDVIGNAGREMISGQANQRALQAFEEGGAIAEAAGRFANPELVANLQARRQQQEQFEQELAQGARQLDISESRLQADAVLGAARATNDLQLGRRRLATIERSNQIDQQLADIRRDWRRAQAAHLGEGEGSGFSESIALRTQEFLEVLHQKDAILGQEISQVVDSLNQIDVTVPDAVIQGIESGTLAPEQINEELIDLSSADASFSPFHVGSGPEQAKALVTQLKQLARRRQSTEAQIEILENTQTERLTGRTAAQQRDATLNPGTGEGETPPAREPQGTPESPVKVPTQRQLEALPVGSIVDFFGTVGRWNGRTIEELEEEEE